MVMLRTWIEPVVAGVQIASSFYDTGLLMTVKNYYNQTIRPSNSSSDDELQKAISNFYIIYNVVMGLTPLLSAYILAKISEKTSIKVTICVPLMGYLISRMFLLFVILLDWPIEVIFGSAAFNGLTGWFTTYWAGVTAWTSMGSSESKRSLKLFIIELVYGLAGFAGSLVSGYIFVHLNINQHQGTILASCSTGCYAFCVLYSIFILKMPDAEEWNAEGNSTEALHESINSDYTEQSRLLGDTPSDNTHKNPTDVSFSKCVIKCMFVSAIVYNIAVTATDDVINVFVLKEPLSWGPVEVGYGNAVAYMTYITSFFGVYIFSKCFGDLGLIIIGMISFSCGILIMAFVRWTYLYYIARAVMLFSLITTPTIRSMISKHVKGSSYGKVFVVLQMAIEVISVSSSAGFNKLYQATLDWYSGFCFFVFSALGFLSIIPVIITVCKQRHTSTTQENVSNERTSKTTAQT
ncbi:thymic stromal cotransporter homolog [Xenopus laevis]|uniref:Thymic stromal cotransporter homolog n=2 Tax=Xenopus laevis TaxID=8355 RepID=A0A974DZ11_XENLA|nr:thymic stromal cotransporter homolog [Xenopus laevis]OCU00740.1 hypothetical protein XELAEV_18006519mg [Xenopus laevis]